ncbi:hypothetical protein P9J64_05685 [Deltaproteobacteria bacterium IMCC39524]|nr:hypothetical protein [Deltaproteobacteria bacterium IMCC39524]
MVINLKYQLSVNQTKLAQLCLLVVMVLTCLASTAEARISGEVALLYTDYSAKEDGEKVSDFSSFSQNYSLYYSKSGFVGDQRLGKYNFGLGYQWASTSATLDTSHGTEDFDLENSDGKFLFNGDITIAPGALPFRFHAFSYDNQAPISNYARTRGVLDRTLITGTRTREEVVSGFTLMAGIRNGSYLGKYRKLLSSLPRAYVDYSQTFIRDLDTLNKVHSLERDLAFVSLNKKDNWFHFRASDYKDYLDSRNNTYTKTILIGTINQNLARQWINMTNWIKLSVDASYTEEESEETLETAYDPKVFSLNLYSQADYGKNHVSVFNNYSRLRDSDKFERRYEIPVFARGVIDHKRSWSLQLRRYADQEDWYNTNFVGVDEEGEYLAARFNNQRSTYTFASTLELERSKQIPTEAFAARLRQEISQTRSYGVANPWLLGYTAVFVHTDGDYEATGGTGDIFEHELYGSSQWALSPRNTLELRQNFRHATANGSGYSTIYISPKGYDVTFDNVGPIASEEALYASETTLSLESLWGAKLKNRLVLSNQVYYGGAEDKRDSSLVDFLTYRSRNWRLEMMNGVYVGDDPPDITVSQSSSARSFSNSTAGGLDTRDVNYILGHSTKVEYFSSRNFKSKANFKFALKDTDNGKVYQGSFFEESEYSLFSRTGRRRALGRLYQQFEYEKYSSDFNTASYLKLLLGATYYPMSYFELGGDIYYETYDQLGIDQIALSVLARLTFSRLTCETRYSYALGKLDDGNYDKRTEHLFEAKVIKTF